MSDVEGTMPATMSSLGSAALSRSALLTPFWKLITTGLREACAAIWRAAASVSLL
jgi:hypothetical protein